MLFTTSAKGDAALTDMFTVGTIVGTHGLKGEVKVISRTDYPELRFSPGSRLWFFSGEPSPPAQLVVKTARRHKTLYLVAFEGYDSIEQAEGLRGSELKVLRSDAPPLPEGEYWIDDLLGCIVTTDGGEELGMLVEVLTPGANDVYVVRQESGKDVLLPAIPECILDVDVENKKVLVHLLPGLVDEP